MYPSSISANLPANDARAKKQMNICVTHTHLNTSRTCSRDWLAKYKCDDMWPTLLLTKVDSYYNHRTERPPTLDMVWIWRYVCGGRPRRGIYKVNVFQPNYIYIYTDNDQWSLAGQDPSNHISKTDTVWHTHAASPRVKCVLRKIHQQNGENNDRARRFKFIFSTNSPNMMCT